jgi:hypothetical protein
MTLTFADIENSLKNEFTAFPGDEGQLDAALDKFPFDQEGMCLRWDWCKHLWKEMLGFLDNRFPKLGLRSCSVICDLYMSPIWEKIARRESEYACYREIVDRLTSELSVDAGVIYR